MSSAARRAHTHALRRRLLPQRRNNLIITMAGDATRAMRQLQRATELVANAFRSSVQSWMELSAYHHRAAEAELLDMLRYRQQFDPSLHVEVRTVQTPTGTVCKVIAKHLGCWNQPDLGVLGKRMQPATTED